MCWKESEIELLGWIKLLITDYIDCYEYECCAHAPKCEWECKDALMCDSYKSMILWWKREKRCQWKFPYEWKVLGKVSRIDRNVFKRRSRWREHLYMIKVVTQTDLSMYIHVAGNRDKKTYKSMQRRKHASRRRDEQMLGDGETNKIGVGVTERRRAANQRRDEQLQDDWETKSCESTERRRAAWWWRNEQMRIDGKTNRFGTTEIPTDLRWRRETNRLRLTYTCSGDREKNRCDMETEGKQIKIYMLLEMERRTGVSEI